MEEHKLWVGGGGGGTSGLPKMYTYNKPFIRHQRVLSVFISWGKILCVDSNGKNLVTIRLENFFIGITVPIAEGNKTACKFVYLYLHSSCVQTLSPLFFHGMVRQVQACPSNIGQNLNFMIFWCFPDILKLNPLNPGHFSFIFLQPWLFQSAKYNPPTISKNCYNLGLAES